MRLTHVLVSSALAAGLLLGGGLSAQAATVSSKPVPLPWNVSAGKFGTYKIGETLGTAAKHTHTNYKTILRPILAGWAKSGIPMCMDAIEIPLIENRSTGMNASKNISAVVQTPCVNKKMSLTMYEKKYHPYTKTKIKGFMAVLSDYGRNSFIPDRFAHTFLPHTAKIDLGDSYTQVLKAYKGQLRDYTSAGTVDNDPRQQRSGYVVVYPKVGNRVIRDTPLFSFYVAGYVGQEKVIELSTGADLYVN